MALFCNIVRPKPENSSVKVVRQHSDHDQLSRVFKLITGSHAVLLEGGKKQFLFSRSLSLPFFFRDTPMDTTFVKLLWCRRKYAWAASKCFWYAWNLHRNYVLWLWIRRRMDASEITILFTYLNFGHFIVKNGKKSIYSTKLRSQRWGVTVDRVWCVCVSSCHARNGPNEGTAPGSILSVEVNSKKCFFFLLFYQGKINRFGHGPTGGGYFRPRQRTQSWFGTVCVSACVSFRTPLRCSPRTKLCEPVWWYWLSVHRVNGSCPAGDGDDRVFFFKFWCQCDVRPSWMTYDRSGNEDETGHKTGDGWVCFVLGED